MTNEKNTEKTDLQEIPQTILALEEAKVLKKDPNKKVYSSFGEVLEELEDDREPEPKGKKTKCIRIDGAIEVQENLSLDDFLNSFIAYIESHGWYFGGKTSDEAEDEYE